MKSKILRQLYIAVFIGASFFRLFSGEAGGAQSKAVFVRTGFSLKLSGGMGIFSDGGGDLENLRLTDSVFKKMLADVQGVTKTSVNWKKLSRAPEFDAELIFHLTKNLGIGVGVGYLDVRSKGNYGYDLFREDVTSTRKDTWEVDNDYNREYKITAIPARLNVHFNFPSGVLNIYAYAGVSYYFAKLTHTFLSEEVSTDFEDYLNPIYEDRTWELIWSQTFTESAKPSRNKALGYQAGLGLELKLISHVALGLEVYGRYADLGRWNGDFKQSSIPRQRLWTPSKGWTDWQTLNQGTVSGSGPLIYYEDGLYYEIRDGRMHIRRPWEDWPAPRNARINLSAVGAAVTLRIF